jgi:LuxR family transcriptional regulator, maltose regulon positive regulatory protein
LPSATESPLEPLSQRELEVLQLLATGRSNREIATELYVATGTIKAHLNNIFRKLEARSRLEAVTRARDLGLLAGGDRE